jgi:hypothetical protein
MSPRSAKVVILSEAKDLLFWMFVLRGCFTVRLLALVLPLSLAGCRPHDFPQYPANYREYAYVTNGGSGTDFHLRRRERSARPRIAR